MPAKAEHVCPAPESTVGSFPLLRMGIVGSLTQSPAGPDEPSGMGGFISVEADGFRGQSFRGMASDFGGFSGVFGQVTSHSSIGECAGEGHRADLELGPPGQGPAVGIGRVRWGGEPGGGDSVGEGLVQIGCGDSRWRWEKGVGVVGVEGVKAEQGVKVDESTGLIFGDFGKG